MRNISHETEEKAKKYDRAVWWGRQGVAPGIGVGSLFGAYKSYQWWKTYFRTGVGALAGGALGGLLGFILLGGISIFADGCKRGIHRPAEEPVQEAKEDLVQFRPREVLDQVIENLRAIKNPELTRDDRIKLIDQIIPAVDAIRTRENENEGLINRLQYELGLQRDSSHQDILDRIQAMKEEIDYDANVPTP